MRDSVREKVMAHLRALPQCQMPNCPGREREANPATTWVLGEPNFRCDSCAHSYDAVEWREDPLAPTIRALLDAVL